MCSSESVVHSELVPLMRNFRVSDLIPIPDDDPGEDISHRRSDNNTEQLNSASSSSTQSTFPPTSSTFNTINNDIINNNGNNNNKDVALRDTVEYRVIHARDERAAGHHHRSSPNNSSNNTSTNTIPKNSVSMEEDESEQYEVAGQMRSVIPSTNILVVQTTNSPAILEELLDNGTPMFERCVRYTYGSVVTGGPREQWYRQIGIIDDLFGSVSEPMYALRLEPGIKPDSLVMGSNVFYMPRNAGTKFIRLRMESSGSYSVDYENDE